MSSKAFASGKYAHGFCDRCGWRYPLDQLREEIVNDARVGNRVCPECYDPDHPQNHIGKVDTSDPQSLRDPRPDQGLDESRTLTNEDAFDDFIGAM